jgi:hypothetical protein
MKRALAILSVLAICFFGFNGLAHATLIGFDDLPTPLVGPGYTSSWGYVPSSYQGLTWTGWEVTENNSYNIVFGDSVTFPSGPNAAYNGGDGNQVVTISSCKPFNFTSAYFWTWTYNNSFWNGVSASSLTVSAYSGGTEKGSVLLNLANAPQEQTFNFTNVDKVTFTENGAGLYWLMDNAQVSAVPIPSSLLLIVPGLFGLVALRKRPSK